jgi:hypothetical protein
MASSKTATDTNILFFPSPSERQTRSARTEATPRALEVSPPGVRQILEMARHALLFCTDRVVVDAVEGGSGKKRARPVRVALEFTEEIKAIDAAMAELRD